MKLLQKIALFWLLLLVMAFHGKKSCADITSTNESDDAQHPQDKLSNSRIVQSLFRFPASKLGPEFNDLLHLWYNEWLHVPSTNTTSSALPPISPDTSAKQHAAHSNSATAATLFRRQCYGPLSSTRNTLYKNLESRRKEIEFQYLQDAAEEMKLLHTMVRRFYPAFLPNEGGKSSGVTAAATQIHKKKAKSTINTIYSLPSSVVSTYDKPSKLAFQADRGDNTQQWTWRPAGHFSSRGTPYNYQFRVNFFNAMRQKLKGVLPLEMGRQSGMFWYPPGSVREWHSNYLDLVGSTKKNASNKNRRDEEIFASQSWRMYFVRTIRDEDFDDKLRKLRGKKHGGNATVDLSANDHSAMHIIPGQDDGITLEVLEKAGARPLTSKEKSKQYVDIFSPHDDFHKHDTAETLAQSTNDVLDRNSVWRIPDQDGYITLFRLPNLWHCIVSEEVHRYSLGFAFSDKEVQSLLKLAKVEFDIETDNYHDVNKISDQVSAQDEL